MGGDRSQHRLHIRSMHVAHCLAMRLSQLQMVVTRYARELGLKKQRVLACWQLLYDIKEPH